MNGTCNGTVFFVPVPLGPWEWAKRSIIIKSQLLSQFQSFLNQTLCVLSQLKDVKHIRWDFHLTVWIMPQGCDLGVLWGVGVNFFLKFNQSWCVSYLHESEWHMQQHNFLGPLPPGALERGQRSNIIKSQLLSQFQIFFNQTLCVFSQMKYINHIRRDFH